MKASIPIWTLLLVAQLVCQVLALNTARYSQSPVQYHIQADTGGDRYFRYQTYNGQWRKEKRLRNGKVIGAYGWTDDRGILRLYDYLADEHGYRVVRERTMKVSDGSPQNQLDSTVKSNVEAGTFSPSLSSGSRNSNPTFSINDIRRKSYEKARKSFDFSSGNDLGKSVQPIITDVEEVTRASANFRELGEGSAAQDNRGHSEFVTHGTNGTPSKNLAGVSLSDTEETNGNTEENFTKEISGSTNILGGNLLDSEGLVESNPSRKDVRTIQRNINEVAKEFNGAQSEVAVPRPTINFDTGTMFHFEELAPEGSKKGRHGYVDPLGFLRVTSYLSGTAGHVETRTSRYVGTRNAGDPT